MRDGSSGGAARCWGYNANGQLGDGTTTQRLLPVVVKNSAGSGALAGVTQLSPRDFIRARGCSSATVQCWGSNANGEIGDGTTTQRPLPMAVPMQ